MLRKRAFYILGVMLLVYVLLLGMLALRNNGASLAAGDSRPAAARFVIAEEFSPTPTPVPDPERPVCGIGSSGGCSESTLP